MTSNERQVQADLYCVLRNAIKFSEEAKGMRNFVGEKSVLDEINKV